MIASYTIAHLKLGINLRNMGYTDFSRRLGVYLTNSLEDTFDIQEDLFSIGLANSIAEEAKSANKIKKDKPIMVVLGNPPYSGESQNPSYKGNDVYKFEPGSTQKLQERNPKWLNDDYVKFIRLAESFIERNEDGIIGMITAHGYLDNPTFRGMRWHLANTFDKIYIIDLHGNYNKKEVRPDGGKDENVFDIKTGVSIILGVKTGNKKKLADVFIKDIYGLRKDKYVELNNNSIDSIKWQGLELSTPNYEFTVRDNSLKKKYDEGFSVNELFIKSSPGITTSRDHFVIDIKKIDLENRIRDFFNCEDADLAKSKFRLKDNLGWKVTNAKNGDFSDNKVIDCSYRPFDSRYLYFDKNLIERPRTDIMRHLINQSNFGFVTVNRQPQSMPLNYYFVTNSPIASGFIRSDSVSFDCLFPIKLIENDGSHSNIDSKIAQKIKEIITEEISDFNIFDYMYAILYSPNYRSKYKEFLKIGFPRVPYPKNAEQFRKLAEKGKELRELHLMESPLLNKLTTTYPIEGTDKVEKVAYSAGSVFINSDQYFGNVPEVAWNFYIGGYQPSQKWLKDRKDRTLTNEDIEHYQKIIIALTETDRIMKEIDLIKIIENKNGS